MSSSQPLIQSVSDTALAVAYARALETERPDALFQDRFARQLAGEQGKNIYQKIKGARSLGWLISTRTALLDALILSHIEQEGIDTVVNLAAGLDTRPYRMALPANLNWIEVDLPPMIDYKQRILAEAKPICQLERIPTNLAIPPERRQLMARINTARKALVITEGLLVYLLPEQVSALAIDLHTHPAMSIWLTDLVSPLSVKFAQLRMSQEYVANDVRFQFAPDAPPDFFQSWGWQIQEARSIWQEAHRLKREVLFGKIARRFPQLEISIVLLQKIPRAG